MTTKKYVLTFVFFAFLLALAPIFFFVGFFIKEEFYIFAACSCISLISAIAFLAINYKKLADYDINKLNKKIVNLDFTIIDRSISETELYNKLIISGYTNKKDIFRKVKKENCGDGNIVNHYYAIIHKTDGIIDIQKVLEYFNKGMTTYNVGYIFINENVKENIEKINEYIKMTILDVKVHAYKYKKFFVPIVITNDKIYYIEDSSVFMDTYKYGVDECIRILDVT